METLGDLIEGSARFVRQSGAPAIAAVWALVGFLVAAVLIRRRRDNFGWKLGGSLLAVGGAAGLLLWWSQQREAEYYKFVDEVVANGERFSALRRHLDVHGCVLAGSIERRVGTDEYRFRLASSRGRPQAVLDVRYTGVLPDPFRAEAEVVVKGTLAADGRLDVVPDGIMAKCPSKYVFDPDSPHDDWKCGDP